MHTLPRHGGPCAVLFNGPSLPWKDLSRIKYPVIGMNRTWNFTSQYYVAMEKEWVAANYEGPHFLNAALDPKWPGADRGYPVRLQYEKPFSVDPFFGYHPASTGYLSLQIALTLFDEVHCLGLDLKGAHFDGSLGPESFEHQIKYFEIAAERILKIRKQVWVCGGRCNIFPRSKLSRVLD